jgi:hypothetical protein
MRVSDHLYVPAALLTKIITNIYCIWDWVGLGACVEAEKRRILLCRELNLNI